MNALTVEHPGPLLPGAPHFRLDLPEGWHVAPAPRALAVARPTEPVTGFQPNLTVTADLVPAGTTPDQVLDAMLAQYPGEAGRTDAADTRTGADESADDPSATTTPATSATAHLSRPHTSGTVHQRVDVHVDATPLPGGHRHAVTVVSSWSATTPTDLRDALAAAHTSVRIGAADPVRA